MRQPLNSRDTHAPNHSLVMVHNHPQACPYLPGREARMPLHWPIRALGPSALDGYMALGYRRSGTFLYHTACDNCRACQPTRLEVKAFKLTRSLRRVLQRGNAVLDVKLQQPQLDAARVELLNRHRCERQLASTTGALDHFDYESFLVETCCDTREMSYWIDGALVAVATVDFGAESLSAVYCFFDPDHGKLSLGTYSILRQLELAAATGRHYLYLGMYVAENPHLNYKARFRPHQRRVGGRWQSFE